MFGQLFRALHFLPPSRLRTADRTWQADLAGENSIDAGGPFRDSITHLCNDLQDTMLPLFVRCANAQGFGDNQDSWMPSPAAVSSLHLSMLAFVGKLMGVAMRAKHILNLNISPLVWKQLVGATLTAEDILDVDALTYEVIQKVRLSVRPAAVALLYHEPLRPHAHLLLPLVLFPQTEPEEFAHDYSEITWATTTADGRQVELVEGGASKVLTFENRMEWADAMVEYRLHEVDTQVAAIRRGMGTIVPVQLLPLFTWQEVELQVCGRRDVNVDFLKANTDVSRVRGSHTHVDMMWDVLREFTPKERELFLRFVWGRSRLPLTTEDFKQKFAVIPFQMRGQGDVDRMLPMSHTCFFQLELPRYSSKEVMKQRLLVAITSCVGIDTDGAAANIANAWRDE